MFAPSTYYERKEQAVSAEENIATIKDIYEAFGRGDLDAILDQCTDDVDWASDVATAVAPWQGPKHGKGELPSFFAGIAGAGTVKEFTPLSFAGNDDDEVMVLLHWTFTVSATGRDVASNIHHYWRLRDGKVCNYRGSEDSAQIAAAFSA
jgi:ketosteroid isomerase-like protein